MKMKPADINGNLYSAGGLLFGGFQTSDFLDATELLEKKQPGVRENIVAEAHYLASWLHKFPEIAFFIGIILYKSFWLALLLFILAFVFEIIRFYIFGASPFLSIMCKSWNWIKVPVFIIAAIIFWPEGNFLSIILLVFLIVQGWFDLVASVGMLPIRLVIVLLIYKKCRGHYWHNMEGLTMNFVIDRWCLKLFPDDILSVNSRDKDNNNI